MNDDGVITITEIMELIPHRHPFLLVDKVMDFIPYKSCKGIKNVTANEGFFQGHFINNPVMPGVLLVESMAQTASVLVAKSEKTTLENNEVLFTTIDSVKFKKSVIPGDTLELLVEIRNHKMGLWFCGGIGIVAGKKVVEAKFSSIITTKKDGGNKIFYSNNQK
jgi:3-hydroxyacyl-[acyl-carrier-protein] dehydratase